MNISILCEGGIGDFICGCRHINPIKNAYPDASLTLFSNTDNNPVQAELINNLWPSYFDKTIQVTRASQECYKESNFGRELYNAAYDNIIESDRELIESADKVFNLHVDSLEFLNYPECRQNINYFPPPEIKIDYNLGLPDKYICLHLMSRPDSERGLEKWYIQKLVKELAVEIPVVVLCEEKYLNYYDFCKKLLNIMVIPADLYECYYLISKSSVFLGVDSSIYHLSKGAGVPYYCFSNFCYQPFQIPTYQQIRWHQNPLAIIPQNYDVGFVKKLILGVVEDYANYLFPTIQFSNQQIDNAIVRRNFI